MKIKKASIRDLGLLVGIACSTMALTLVVRAQSCNIAGSASCYGGNLNDPCSADSPNCSGGPPYPGTVTSLGTQKIITGASGAQCGLDGHYQDGFCYYVCTLTSDCKMESPQVDIAGSANVVPSGNVCPPGCSGCNNGGH